MLKNLGWVLKIGIILFGLAEFLGLMPESLELADRVITSLVLLVFWYALRPASFMFGKDSRWLDITILIGFYIMSLNVFLAYIVQYYPQIPEQILRYISLTVLILGRAILVLVAFYVALRVNIGERSIVHSILYLFRRTAGFWEKFSAPGGYFLLRFAFSFIALYIIVNYFFLLVTQWFIVSLDKSLLVVAVLFAFKDIRGHRIEAINKIGEFSERLLAAVTRLFTEHHYAHLGFGFLLIFHYLSDVSLFIIPYLTGLQSEFGYYGLTEETHRSLIWHYGNEVLGTGFQHFGVAWTYIISGAGLLVMFLIPIVLMLLYVFKANMTEFEWKKRFIFPLLLFLMAGSVFMIAPWVEQVPIKGSETGVYGVDFVTHRISDGKVFEFEEIFVISVLILAMAAMAMGRRGSEFFVTMLFLASMMYFGYYCWNFFISSADYYWNLGFSNLPLALDSSILLFLNMLFYLGGFCLLMYTLSKYVVTHFIRELRNKPAVIVWLLGSFLVTIFVISLINAENVASVLALLFSFLVTLFLFNTALYFVLREEHNYDFVPALTMVLGLFPLLVILGSVIGSSFGIPEEYMNILSRVALSVVAVLLLMLFRVRSLFNRLRGLKLGLSLFVGLLLGFTFLLAREPVVLIPKGMLYVLVFLFLVAFSEELIFRSLIFRVLQRSLDDTTALFVQALMFALLHFLFLGSILTHYGGSIMAGLFYFVLIFAFGVILGTLIGKRKEEKNVLYPMVAHFAANFVVYFSLFF